MLTALLFLAAAALPVPTPDPAVEESVRNWIVAADESAKAGNAPEAAANLWRAAEATDHKLRDYHRAVALYDRLVREYPAARLARAAASRRDDISRATAEGAEPYARFERVRAELSRLDREAARKEVREIVDENPKFPIADEALLWLADRAAEAGDVDEAEKTWRELLARFPQSAVAAHAWAGLGRSAFARGDWTVAEDAFSRIAGTSVAGAAIVSRKEVEIVRRHRTRAERLRWVLGFLAIAVVAAVVTVEPKRLPRAVRASVGRELLYTAPVFALLVLVAPHEGRASIAAVAALGVGFLWAALVWADAARPALARPSLKAMSTIAGTLTGIALAYVVLYALDLLVAVERLIGDA